MIKHTLIYVIGMYLCRSLTLCYMPLVTIVQINSFKNKRQYEATHQFTSTSKEFSYAVFLCYWKICCM